MVKLFFMLAGIWNILDGIVSIKLRSLGHSRLSDSCRVVRVLIGFGLLLVALFSK